MQRQEQQRQQLRPKSSSHKTGLIRLFLLLALQEESKRLPSKIIFERFDFKCSPTRFGEFHQLRVHAYKICSTPLNVLYVIYNVRDVFFYSASNIKT